MIVPFGSVLLALAAASLAGAPPTALESRVESCWKLAVADPAAALRLVEAPAEAGGARAASPTVRSALAELRLCRGYAQEQLGKIELAGADYQWTVDEAATLGDEKLLASALALRGELAYYRGAFTGALADLDRAYKLEVQLGRGSRQRYDLNAIANVYADPRVGAYSRAIEYYRQLLAAHETSGEVGEQATCHFNLGSTFERQGDLPAALAEYERAVALDRSLGDADETAYAERAVANALVKLGRARDALPRIERVVAYFTKTGNDDVLAQARLTRGIARRAAGDPAGALADLDAAAVRFRSEKNDRFLVRVEQERAEALAALGEWSAAFQARSSQTEIERRLAEATRAEATSRLRVEFDSEKKETENRALARENELRGRALAAAERARSLQRAVIGLAAALVLLLGWAALRQLAQARRMRVLAMTDELTRLPNRRAFFALAGEALAAARGAGTPIALVAFDVDHFKRVNDSFGHEAGDRVLQRVANAARGALRPGDTVGRTGGEEFLALLPGAREEAAVEVAERLRNAVAALDVADLGRGLRVSVSLGAAARQDDEASIDALARRADEALYRAKQGGRNRTERASAAPV